MANQVASSRAAARSVCQARRRREPVRIIATTTATAAAASSTHTQIGMPLSEASSLPVDSVAPSVGLAVGDGVSEGVEDGVGDGVGDGGGDFVGDGVADSVADAVALLPSDGVTEAVGSGVGLSASSRLGERVGLGREAVREGPLAVSEALGDGSVIEPSPPPHAVSSKAAVSPSAGNHQAPTRLRATSLDVTSDPPATGAQTTPRATAWGVEVCLVQQRETGTPRTRGGRMPAMIGLPVE